MAGEARPMSTAEMDGIYERVKNWGRWGADDERGALNLITPAHRAAASALVKHGRTVSCALPLATSSEIGASAPVAHYMIRAGDVEGGTASADYFAVASHGVS